MSQAISSGLLSNYMLCYSKILVSQSNQYPCFYPYYNLHTLLSDLMVTYGL